MNSDNNSNKQDKHYIIRTPHDPFEVLPYSELHDHIGNNVGNLMYVAGVTRAMMVTDGTTFDKTKFHFAYTDEEIDEINETCDGFLISLADAIRPNYIDRMNQMTETISKLKIPCVVIGVGLRAPYEPGSDMSYPFDDDVRRFFSAVLDHSASVGLRGQITGEYLKHLGFHEEQDFTIIGCPSMYMYGRELPFRDTIADFLADRQSPCAFNISPSLTDKTLSLISDLAAEYPNSVYMPQNSKDERLMYYGKPISKEKRKVDNWPVTLDHPFYRDHEALFFNHPVSWINFQRSNLLSFGTRLHGNITAVLAGTPALFMPQVARTRELCEFHGFANLSPQELEKEDDLKDVLPQMDFSKPVRMQEKNFDHYHDFLRKNGLSNIYDYPDITEAPYDRKVKGYEDLPPLHQVSRESAEVQVERKQEWIAAHPPKDTGAAAKQQNKSIFSRIGRKIRKAAGK